MCDDVAGTIASLTDEETQCTVGIAPAEGQKCERCWHYGTDIRADGDYPGTCDRCAKALKWMNFPPVTKKPKEEAAAEPAAA